MKDSLGTAQGLLAHRAAPAFVHALNHLTESLGHHSWLVPPGKDLAGGGFFTLRCHSVGTVTPLEMEPGSQGYEGAALG